MTIYRKNDVIRDFSKIKNMQNTWYESEWSRMFFDHNKQGLFFEESKIVNLSINVVSGNPNQFDIKWKDKIDKYSVKNLNRLFVEHKQIIDINFFHLLKNFSPHISYEPIFVPIDRQK